MKTAHIVLLCVVVFVLGGVAGGAVIWRMTSAHGTQTLAHSSTAGVGTKTRILNALRQGNTAEAELLLEISLDSDLVVLGLLPDTMLDPATKRAIARAAAYRAKYPYTSREPIVAEAVARFLAEHAQAGAR